MAKCKELKIRQRSEAGDIYRIAHADYTYTTDVMSTDSQRFREAKHAMESLTESDRNLMILYAEVGSMEKTARLMDVSKNTLRVNINRIRELIKKIIDENNR